MTRIPITADRFRDPGTIELNVPPALAAKLAFVCARTGISPQAFILDLVDDAIDDALRQEAA